MHSNDLKIVVSLALTGYICCLLFYFIFRSSANMLIFKQEEGYIQKPSNHSAMPEDAP